MKPIGLVILIWISINLSAETISSNTLSSQEINTKQFTECFGTSMWMVQGKDLNKGKIPKTVKIPEGWVPIGGGTGNSSMGGSYPIMILCR